ncbi:hypothetical protein GCM10022224_004920 [Nonomuraea antimicrobica]|uniref:Uncharacterized protein n=1 Tax=Nonomuraea antimicrobica TaxID=561173 RepID=A0ABP7B1S6_9ACTN
MRLPRQRQQPEEPRAASDQEPERIPQRWVVILIAALVGGLVVGSPLASVPVGVATALGLVGLLDRIMR